MKMWRRRRSFSSVMTFTVVPLAEARALKDDGILLHSSMGSAELLSRQINANKNKSSTISNHECIARQTKREWQGGLSSSRGYEMIIGWIVFVIY